MIFEIYNRDKKRIFYTEHAEALPDLDILDEMIDAKYIFKCDGEVIPSTKITKWIKDHRVKYNPPADRFDIFE